MRRLTPILATVVWGLAFFPTAFFALFAPMMFDSPGSTSNHGVQIAFVSMVSFPILCLISIFATWVATGRYQASSSKAAVLVPLAFACLPLVAAIPVARIAIAQESGPVQAASTPAPQSHRPMRQIAAISDAYSSIAAGAAGVIYYVATNASNDALKKVSSDGTVTSVGTGLKFPRGIAVEARGNVYAGTPGGAIARIAPDGAVSTAARANISSPSGVAVDAHGNLYVAGPRGSRTGASTVEKIAPDGKIASIGSQWDSPNAVGVDANGNVYVADAGNRSVKKVAPGGAVTAVGSGWVDPEGLAVDAAGNLYVADAGSDTIAAIAPDGTRTTVGSGFGKASDVAIDARGTIYLTAAGKIWVLAPQ